MKRCLFSLIVFLTIQPISLVADDGSLTVVELFTSQGCSSCPPADTYLGELAQRKDVIALSFHVDYWDYIGWKDPYASSENTTRQKNYARQMSLRHLYTPQMVVQGTYEGTGSDRGKISRFINAAKAIPHVPIGLRAEHNTTLNIAIAGWDHDQISLADQTFKVWAVVYDKVHSTAVKRGENSGRMIDNYNVVQNSRRIGDWKGNPENLMIPLAQLTGQGGEACAVFIQSEETGQILGAASIDL